MKGVILVATLFEGFSNAEEEKKETKKE